MAESVARRITVSASMRAMRMGQSRDGSHEHLLIFRGNSLPTMGDYKSVGNLIRPKFGNMHHALFDGYQRGIGIGAGFIR